MVIKGANAHGMGLSNGTLQKPVKWKAEIFALSHSKRFFVGYDCDWPNFEPPLDVWIGYFIVNFFANLGWRWRMSARFVPDKRIITLCSLPCDISH
jgi:hypothetical protein